MKALFGRNVGIVVAAVLAGCAGQPEQLSMQGPSGQSQAITFPNGTVFGGASSKEASSLAQIAVNANNNSVKEFTALTAGQQGLREGQQALTAGQQRQLQTSQQEFAALQAINSKELQTSQKAVQMLDQLSAQQGTGQITLFFPAGAATISQGSLEYQRLVNFLDYLSRQSRGRKVHFVLIGSASATGNQHINERLSKERADAPVPIIDQFLVNVPHDFYKVTGLGDTYSPKDVSLQADQRYQNVRIIAVYQTDQVPPLPGDAKR
jgi:outer membrane protein OmpA-like peptidoglycan-associated protein